MKAKSKLKDGKFDYGDIEMTNEEYREAQNPKIRTTIFLEASLIQAFKQEAARRGVKYQQLMRERLKDAIEKGRDSIEDRLVRLETAMAGLRRTGGSGSKS